MPRFLLLLLVLLLTTVPALAADAGKEYKRAFIAIASNHPQEAENVALHGPDPVLNKVVRGYAMALPNNDYSFDQLDSFLNDNPSWPGLKGIQMIAEQKIPPNASAAQVIAWFSDRPPISLAGFYRYIDALNMAGQAQAAQTAIRERWIGNDFTGDEQTSFYTRFGALLDGNAMWARTNRLLWKNDVAGAERMMPYLGAADKAVAQARMALAAGRPDAEAWVSRVPSSMTREPGLIFQRLRQKIKANRDEEADNILLHAPSDLGDAEAWWEQRQIMIRRAIGTHDFALAYRLAANHGQTATKPLVQAEFLCGWLALRFLDKPADARIHFQTLYDNASTPITRARGAYWLGRTYEALGDKNAAEQAYEDAAIFNNSYYGQLAMARIYADPVLTAKADPPLPENVRKAFMARDNIRAIMRLTDIGETEHARSFFRAAVESADERAEFILLTDVAAHIHRPDLGITTVKAASQKDMIVENGGYPLIAGHVPNPPEAAFTHALIRQESMFNPDASSGVGARGLMQLMPRTAKEVAKKLDIRYSETRLSDPDYSLKLGTSFVQQQIDHFNGSYILALAGYNAGPGRVHEWLGQFGDPRRDNVDPIDWIELIPVQETRNYVQRIIENIQIYRAKLAGGHAPLLIIKDLQR